MIDKLVSKTEPGIKPEDVQKGEFYGILLILNVDNDVAGYVYHYEENDTWVIETVDFLSDDFETFNDLWDYWETEPDFEDFKMIVRE